MGFRFRKSIKAGPLRVNLSKSGVGYSVGGKSFRYTKKASGGTCTTASIPGTGISYVQDFGGTKNNTPKKRSSAGKFTSQGGNNIKKPKNSITEFILCLLLGWAGGHQFYRGKKGLGFLYLLTFGLFIIGWWSDLIQLFQINFGKSKGVPLSKGRKVGSYFIAFLCVMIVGGCNSDSDANTVPVEPTMAVAAPADAIKETVTQTAELNTVPTAEPTTEPSTAPTTVPTTEAATEPATVSATEAAAESAPVSTEPVPEGKNYVLNTNSQKFHYPSCSSADDIKASNRKDVVATREELINQHYEPCGRCHP